MKPLWPVLLIISLATVGIGFSIYKDINPQQPLAEKPAREPVLVVEKEGVRVWRVWDDGQFASRWVYFTTGEPSRVWPAP